MTVLARPSLIATLLLSAMPVLGAGAPRVLDDFTTAEAWQAVPSTGVKMAISTDAGREGRALRVDFDFGSGGGYAIARLPVRLDLPENYELSFLLRGETPLNTLEFKLIDETGDNVWWKVRRRYRFPTDWTRLRYKRRHLGFAWGPKGGGEIRKTSALEIVVTAADGGKGTIWVDDLTFTPLEPERPYDLTPSLDASSESGRDRAASALDGDMATAWKSRRAEKQQLEIDFLKRREIGGLAVHWLDGAFASDYDVLLSTDGRTWDTAWRVRGGDGGTDWIPAPESEARHVRMKLLSGPGRQYGIREIEVLDPVSTETTSAMWERIAAGSPRGSYPKYLLREQTYWTIVGAPADMGEALISEYGAIDIDPIRFSIEPFIHDGSSFLTWADAKETTQSLANGDLPIPSVVRDYGEIDLEVTAFARGEEGHSVLWARYRLSNSSGAAKNVMLDLAIRPVQVNPTWQFLATPGGAADVTSIERQRDRFVVNDTTEIVPLTPPDAFGAMRFDQGEIIGVIREGGLPSRASAEDPFGSASAAMRWNLSIPPGGHRDVVITIPFHERPADLHGGLTLDEAAAVAQAELDVAKTEWEGRLGRVAIRLPGSASHVARAIRSNLAYILINMDGPSIQPGSRSYDRSWIRDGSLTSAALLRLGHPEEVKRFIEWYARFQREDGYVPCCVGRRGGDPVPENDSHGELIYLVLEYYRFTGDDALLLRMWPRVEKAVGYIDQQRHLRMTDEYRSGEKQAYFGLMTPSISHEGYPQPVHSYWDDSFTLTGLVAATEIARILGLGDQVERIARIRDEFRRDYYASIERTMAMHGIDFIPGSVELGDFDATSTTVAINPGDALGRMPEPALHNTFDRYWNEFVERMNGEKEWDAYTPYEWRTVGTFVRMGRPERAKTIIDWFLGYSRPEGWNHWAEVVHHDPLTPKFIGDMPHTWVGSDFIRSILDMFAYERGDAMVIGQALPLEWVTEGDGAGVEMLRTPHGPLTWSIRREGDSIVAEINDGLEIPDGGIVVVSPVDQSEKVVRELPARVMLGRASGVSD